MVKFYLNNILMAQLFFFVASFRPPFFFPPHETSLRSARANRCLRPPVFAYGAQSDEWVVPVVEPFRLSPSPSRAEGHSIAHENTMNAIAALPSLTVAPRARVTRKVAAKARAVRPDRAGRGDHRTANRECRESLLSGSRVSGLLAAPSDAPRHRDFPRRPRDSHGTIPTPLITKRRPASPSWPRSRCVSVPRSTPGPNRARQRGSLGATISFSICVSSQVFLFVFQRRLR